jgi:hypothetical protein
LVAEIKRFLNDYPETTKKTDAEARIEDLYNDINWVMAQNTLEDYRRFSNRFPMHPMAKTIEKK